MRKYKNRKCKKIRYKKRKNKMTKNKQETQEIETETDAQPPTDASTDVESSQEDKISCTISWLVGLSLLFVLIIVIGLFERVVIIHVNKPEEEVNNCVVTVLRICLYLSSFIISILSGCIVYQKGKENRQKQQDMTGKIEKLDNVLKQIYGEGKPNG